MNRTLRFQNNITAEELLKPESALEQKLLTIPEFSNGLYWGTPRFGHPEGKVLFHVRDVLDNIDRLQLKNQTTRAKLRIIALVHDTFKYQESGGRHPRDWTSHHAFIARRFMEQHSSDPAILNTIQWHDEAYYCWRLSVIYRNPSDGKKRLRKLFDHIGDDLLLYYQFFVCDTRTDGKNQAPIKWLEARMPGIAPIRI